MVRITIDTDALPGTVAADAPVGSQAVADGGAGPSAGESDPAGDSGANDGGGPPLWLLEAVARAEAGEGSGRAAAADSGISDAGPGPDGGQG